MIKFHINSMKLNRDKIYTKKCVPIWMSFIISVLLNQIFTKEILSKEKVILFNKLIKFSQILNATIKIIERIWRIFEFSQDLKITEEHFIFWSNLYNKDV